MQTHYWNGLHSTESVQGPCFTLTLHIYIVISISTLHVHAVANCQTNEVETRCDDESLPAVMFNISLVLYQDLPSVSCACG